MTEDKHGSSYVNRMFGEFKALALGLCWHYILQVGGLFVQYFLDPIANFKACIPCALGLEMATVPPTCSMLPSGPC